MIGIHNQNTFTSIIIDNLLKKDPSWTAFTFNEQKIDVKKINKQTDMFIMNLQRLGIKKGDVVGYTFPNSPDAMYIAIALCRMGVCSVPLFHMIPPVGRVGIFLSSGVKLIVTDSSQSKALKDACNQMKTSIKVVTTDECMESDGSFLQTNEQLTLEESVLDTVEEELPLMMASSSGTTGIPKAVLFTQKNGAASLKASIELSMPIQYDGKEGYSCMLAFPFSSPGILVILGMVSAGVSCIFSDNMSPVKFLELIRQYKADSIAAPPAYLERILRLPMAAEFDVSSVNRVLSGMDFFSNQLILRLKEKFPHITRAGNGYGLVETTNIFMTWKANNEQELSSPSNELTLVPDIGNEIEVFNQEDIPCSVGEEGELRMRGNSSIRGYLGNDEENAKAYRDGWFKTGDHVKKLRSDKIALLGRKKYVIKRGGRSVSPLIIKEVVEKVAGIINVAVIGVPHELYGEMIWVYVVPAEGSQITEGEIIKACRENLAAYMVPDNVVFIEEIPVNPGAGKVNFELLKEMSLKELDTMGGMINETN